MSNIKLLARLHSVHPAFVYKILQLSNNTVRSDSRFLDLYWRLVADERMLLSIREAYNLYHHLARSLALGGAVAELGVYRGGSARLLCEFKANLPLHLFDTFDGMPAVSKAVDLHHQGDFSDTSLAEVRRYLEGFRAVHLHPGLFPGSTQGLPEDLEFSFVHLDVDLYESTRAGLEYFHPRLQRGGVLISHDYGSLSCPGARKAVDEYFRDRPQDVVALWDTQCLIRKT